MAHASPSTGRRTNPTAARPSEPAAAQPLRPTLLSRLVKVTCGSALFVTLKTLLVWGVAVATPLPAWANYACVTVGISLLGWVYHSKVSFDQPLTRRTLGRYVQQAVALKVVDYGLYNGLVYGVGADVVLAVLVTGGLVFATRVVVYLKYVFAPTGAAPLGVAAAEG